MNAVSDSAQLTQFSHDINKILSPEHIITRYIQRFAYGTDASFYRVVPKMVIKIDNEKALRQTLKLALQHKIPVTFRAAGTSLSGQAITDSVLIVLSPKWNNITIAEQGKQVTLQPGVIGAHANQALASYGYKIGPDPASINSCKIGGIAANNASGMCCGVKQNSYHTLCDMTLVLADGTVLDTADVKSVTAFENSHGPLLDGLRVLHEQVRQDQTLAEKIRHKYRLKNTTGYGINALLDFEQPLDMLKHLMIGSEGTLGFIADITYHTVIDEGHRASCVHAAVKHDHSDCRARITLIFHWWRNNKLFLKVFNFN